ncbi:hypothetical protein [Flammeovirga aprica]|uniref:Uncharacterized protein n=1 Tax=Flammeovirga aprica JL-4 TaxID=694437 RepID=A0A7X9S0V3_9BACT|nr:hypothetical protein [Flammeovirga aprica]NME72308.1 hypothetical protein [Flammeovirga aprica JL-4]
MKKFLLFIVPTIFLVLDFGVIQSAINADTKVGVMMASISAIMVSAVAVLSVPMIKNS